MVIFCLNHSLILCFRFIEWVWTILLWSTFSFSWWKGSGETTWCLKAVHMQHKCKLFQGCCITFDYFVSNQCRRKMIVVVYEFFRALLCQLLYCGKDSVRSDPPYSLHMQGFSWFIYVIDGKPHFSNIWQRKDEVIIGNIQGSVDLLINILSNIPIM